MDSPLIAHGEFMDSPRTVRFICLHGHVMAKNARDSLQTVHGQSVDSQWIARGQSMDDPWTTHG